MQLSELILAHGGQAALAKALGCNKSYVNRAVKRGRLGTALAVRIYRQTGHKLGPVEGMSTSQIAAMEQVSLRQPQAA